MPFVNYTHSPILHDRYLSPKVDERNVSGPKDHKFFEDQARRLVDDAEDDAFAYVDRVKDKSRSPIGSPRLKPFAQLPKPNAKEAPFGWTQEAPLQSDVPPHLCFTFLPDFHTRRACWQPIQQPPMRPIANPKHFWGHNHPSPPKRLAESEPKNHVLMLKAKL
ncbi:hypothetical protein HDU96_008604 [Phlyctochytrium bullatum]|nr:hypothetical protein HDU96_008604 [Phlyctochytrium bullatum]